MAEKGKEPETSEELSGYVCPMNWAAYLKEKLDKISGEGTNDDMKTTMKTTTKGMKPKPEESLTVFLGGACGGLSGPTTWRKDVAIPILDKSHVTYFNPQVDIWTPDLIEVEDNAKTNAQYLLMVLDPKTRGIVTMVEVAYLSGQNRAVVYAPTGRRSEGHINIKGDVVSDLEIHEMVKSQTVLKSIISRQQTCREFPAVDKSVEYIIKACQNGIRLGNNGKTSNETSLGETLLHRQLRRLPQKLARMVKSMGKPKYKEAKSSQSPASEQPSVLGVLTEDTSDQLMRNVQNMKNSLGLSQSTKVDRLTVGDVDVETLKKTYSRILVHIPSNQLSSALMCQAAYLLPHFKNKMIFVIDEIKNSDNGAKINNNMTVTKAGIQDFNRGRKYLRDMVRKSHGQLCMDVDEAVHKLLGITKTPTNDNNNNNIISWRRNN